MNAPPIRNGGLGRKLSSGVRKGISSRLLVAGSLAVRTATTLGTFALLARYLGPHDFGLFSTAIAWSTMAALITDFGFAMKALRDIGAEPGRAGEIAAGFFRVKLCLTVVITLIAILAIGLLSVPWPMKLAIGCLYAATILISYGDLMLLTFRGIGAFAAESKTVIWTALVHGIIVTGTVLAGAGLPGIALSYLVSRGIYAIVATAVVKRRTGMPLAVGISPREIRTTLVTSAPFALDTILTVVYGQFDAVMVSSLVGLHAAGIYMAGTRLVAGVLPLSSVLAGVQIPALARGHAENDPGQPRRRRRALGEFIGVGLITSLCMLVMGPLLVRYAYGPAYNELNALWPGFALFTLARFIAAGMGVQLVVIGRIYGRIIGTAITTAVTFGGFIFLLPRTGVTAAPWLMAAGMLLLCVLYGRQLFGREQAD